jgi:hypothetical protein
VSPRCAGNHRARGLCACGAAREGQQRDVARALDGFTKPALMPRADTGHAARENLSALLYELRQYVGAFVVDEVHLLDTKLADFLLAEILALAAARSTRTSARTATGTTFATRSAVSTTGTSVAARSTFAAWAAWTLCLLLFLCHDCLPFKLLLRSLCRKKASGLKARATVAQHRPASGSQNLRP